MSWSIVRQIKAYRLRQTTLSVYLFLKVETGILNKTLFFHLLAAFVAVQG